ncbi:MAG: NAD(P)H-dependent glycerol-3-phosphate dehydrogenase [Bacteroidales bacterium]|nr:NAD(P)H-dependent glycerol-3-phosphate dehydrogenase [Bacteroidales bacterium]
MQTAVIGGGSWGTALTKLLSDNGHTIAWWVRQQSIADYISHHKKNPAYLTHAPLHTDKIEISTNLEAVLASSEIIFIAVPAAFINDVFNGTSLHDKTVVSAVKGLIPENGALVSDYLHKKFLLHEKNIGMLSGPCHSEEVAMKKLSYVTLALNDNDNIMQIKDMLENRYLKVNISHDIKGIGLAAVLKNIYGIAAGIANGLGYGDNFRSVLIANSIREMDYVLKAWTGNHRNILDSVYTGDLLVTAYSGLSRNWMLGNMIGKGQPAKSALLKLYMVAEGYYAVGPVKNIVKKLHCKTPVINAVYDIVVQNIPPENVFKILSKNIS